jgi:SAM-dependent methyltransferase
MAVAKRIRKVMGCVPLAGTAARFLWVAWKSRAVCFSGSVDYWENRYRQGLTSGDGSYGRLALFKAEILNDFVSRNSIGTILELGCGDGNQLSLANYPQYVGIDVGPTAVELCRKRFVHDPAKTFAVCDPATLRDGEVPFRAELSLSLDVIYHLVEDKVYEAYMRLLFDAAERFVIIYSSNDEEAKSAFRHVRHRKFTDWVERNRPQWQLWKFIPNRYPFKPGHESSTSFADFYIYRK